jgi:HK97 family phage prohead protease
MTNIAENFTETQYKSMPGQISTNEALGIVECFTAAIGNKDSVGDICLPGCFDSSLRRRKPRVVWGHNWNEPIGKVLDIYEVGPNDPRLPVKMRANGVGGLYTRVQFNLKSERGREAFNNITFFGEEQEWSIGYKTLDAFFDSKKQANLLKEVELYEVSPVLHGANQLTATISIKSDKQPIKDPKGGLTAAGRAHFKKTEGADLKPGVKGPADTPQKMRRKGSFLTRFFTNPSGPMKDDNGKPTRLALSAAAWGESVPQNAEDAAKLAAKGRRLLDKYDNTKKKSDSPIEIKNMAIYSGGTTSANPISGRMGDLARHLSAHFGGQVAVREADESTVIFDLDQDGSTSTMRAGWHTPDGERFMFGTAHQVKPETVYIPLDGGPSIALPEKEPKRFADSGDFYDSLMARDSELHGDDEHGDCGCGCGGAGKCGVGKSAMKSWSSFKDDTPGLHMFVKTQNVEMYEAANEIGNSHGFEVELLADGFAIPNMDWYGPEAQNALMTALEAISEKGLGRAIGRARGSARSMGKPSRDGDNDGNTTNPVTGEDDMPFVKPNRPDKPMMPEKPQEIPHEIPEEVPSPIRVPGRPAPSTPTPSRPSVPVPPKRVPANGVTGSMGLKNPGDNILSQLREFENDRSNPSGNSKRGMDAAIRHIAKRNMISEEKVRRRLRQAIMRERRNNVLARAAKARGKSELSVYVSISENHDLEIKSGLQIQSSQIDGFQIDIHPSFIFDIKSAVDTVAEYHGFTSTANDNGIWVTGIAAVGVDGVNALVNTISQIEKQQPLEVYELSNFLG